ncbi:hypothetical protein ACO0RG_004762 [Hanseniaspora osmophila]|uniref:Protein AIM2 n=1 Tax=Hanseniaspora osmophila TaxID=56408 RepID=A0A1E5RZQ1_9ASCO|nr:Protein AIM2 [Hanseniaspora osmophila]
MASNPPAACCFEGFLHEGTPKGVHKELFGLNTYISTPTDPSKCKGCECGGSEPKECEKVIVMLTDVFGNTLTNCLLIADDLANQGFKVLIPDILLGETIDITKVDKVNFQDWMSRHENSITKPVVDAFMQKVKAEMKPNFLGVVGHCFGAKFAVQQLDHSAENKGVADCAAVAHPSFVTMEELAAIEKPLLISAAENDDIFPAELRHQSEDKLKEIGATYQLDLFGGVSHGFAARGDVSDPKVKYAKEKVLLDQIYWFKHFSA